MRKILFAIKGMYLGGTEKVMLSLLNNMDHKDLDVTILLLDKEGPLMKDIPDWYRVQYIESLNENDRQALLRYGFVDNVRYYLKHFRLLKAFTVICKRLFAGDLLAECSNFKSLPMFSEEEYDIAISFQFHNVFMTRYVAEKINAKKKMVWVHNDLSTTKFKYKYTYPYIENFESIYSVSKTIEKELKAAYPKMVDKISTKYNYLDYKEIDSKSQEVVELPYSKDTFSILSIGRLNKQKGFDIAIESATILRRNDVNFKWFVIGEGEERTTLEGLIKKNGLEDRFVLLGAKSNPFPYIKGCSLYVQSSRHEGFCTTTREALTLNKAVISTRVSGADEQIDNQVNGFIVDINAQSIADKIKELYLNREEIEKVEDYLKSHNGKNQEGYYDFLG